MHGTWCSIQTWMSIQKVPFPVFQSVDNNIEFLKLPERQKGYDWSKQEVLYHRDYQESQRRLIVTS
jgi:hypothetical protein